MIKSDLNYDSHYSSVSEVSGDENWLSPINKQENIKFSTMDVQWKLVEDLSNGSGFVYPTLNLQLVHFAVPYEYTVYTG